LISYRILCNQQLLSFRCVVFERGYALRLHRPYTPLTSCLACVARVHVSVGPSFPERLFLGDFSMGVDVGSDKPLWLLIGTSVVAAIDGLQREPRVVLGQAVSGRRPIQASRLETGWRVGLVRCVDALLLYVFAARHDTMVWRPIVRLSNLWIRLLLLATGAAAYPVVWIAPEEP
jgi:hypothetical protein